MKKDFSIHIVVGLFIALILSVVYRGMTEKNRSSGSDCYVEYSDRGPALTVCD
jgi:hypothetical protein